MYFVPCSVYAIKNAVQVIIPPFPIALCGQVEAKKHFRSNKYQPCYSVVQRTEWGVMSLNAFYGNL